MVDMYVTQYEDSDMASHGYGDQVQGQSLSCEYMYSLKYIHYNSGLT